MYSYSEAAHLLRVSKSKVRAWAEGYVYNRSGKHVRQAPVLQGQRPYSDMLTFQDLIELMIVSQLREAGVKLQEIRDAAQLLAEDLDTPYPFANQRLYTDGVQILREHGKGYQNVAKQQQVFEFVEEFFKNIKFKDDIAVAWTPMGPDVPVLVDPHRSFGAPIETARGVRTDIIHSTYRAEGDMSSVAEWYDIPLASVEAAVRFEEQWQQKAA